MKCLVTGGAGFIGSSLCERLLNNGDEVVCFDNYWRGKKENIQHLYPNKRFGIVKGDIRDFNAVKQSMKGCEIVYHLAAINGTKYFYEKPLLVIDVNIKGTENVLKASLEAGVERVLFASSSEVYGEAQEIPIAENAMCNLDNPSTTLRHSYSASKFIGDVLCLSYHKKFGLPVTVIRYFNVYGPRLVGTAYGQVVSIFIKRVLEGKPPIIYGDGNQTRSLTYVTDSVEGTIQATQSKNGIGEVFNIGVEKETSINELAEIIIRLCGEKDLKPIYKKALPGDCKRRCPDATKARKICGWEPTVALEEGLKKTIEWFKSLY